MMKIYLTVVWSVAIPEQILAKFVGGFQQERDLSEVNAVGTCLPTDFPWIFHDWATIHSSELAVEGGGQPEATLEAPTDLRVHLAKWFSHFGLLQGRELRAVVDFGLVGGLYAVRLLVGEAQAPLVA